MKWHFLAGRFSRKSLSNSFLNLNPVGMTTKKCERPLVSTCGGRIFFLSVDYVKHYSELTLTLNTWNYLILKRLV